MHAFGKELSPPLPKSHALMRMTAARASKRNMARLGAQRLNFPRAVSTVDRRP